MTTIISHWANNFLGYRQKPCPRTLFECLRCGDVQNADEEVYETGVCASCAGRCVCGKAVHPESESSAFCPVCEVKDWMAIANEIGDSELLIDPAFCRWVKAAGIYCGGMTAADWGTK